LSQVVAAAERKILAVAALEDLEPRLVCQLLLVRQLQ
jgi:hypothetical protein